MTLFTLTSVYAIVSGGLKLAALILIILACIKYLRTK